MATASSGGLNSLATLIKRLEAATSRLEDIAEVVDSTRPGGAATTVARVSAEEIAPPAPVELPKSVAAFRADVIAARLKPFVALTKELGSQPVSNTVSLVEKQYEILDAFLEQAAACQKPDGAAFEKLVQPFRSAIEPISNAKDANPRERDFVNHLTVLAEGAAAIAWVLSPKPGQWIIDIKESVQFWANRIIKDMKEKDPKHVAWVNGYTGLLNSVQAYIKEYHAAGVTWNPKGVNVSQYKARPTSGVPAAAGGPPPPPPPPPPAPAPAPVAPAAAAPNPAAVFAQLNRGEEVTKGLRKVDKSEMTHKNPTLRASSVVPGGSSPTGKKPTRPTKPIALAGRKPPKLALEGNKWLVEWQEGGSGPIVIEETSINQSVHIFNCRNTTVVVKGKVNAVSLHGCTKTSVLVESVIASVSVNSSPSFTIQITGTAPMVQIDSSDSGQIYLSKESLNSEITTAKCSAINISLPVEGEEDGVFEEQAVPEMFKTTIVNGKLVTSIVEHTG